MEIIVLEQDKNKLKFEIPKENHTFLNMLRKELWSDDSVNISGYKIKHSLVGNPIMILETERGSPITALNKAVERLKKKIADLKTEIKKL